MNKTQTTGIALFFFGILLILGYIFYKLFLEVTDFPEIIKYALLLIFFGLFLVLISLSIERIKEMKK